MEIDAYFAISVFSGVIILAFLYEHFASRLKIPSILLLIFTGIGLGVLARNAEISLLSLANTLPALGTIALILIVFEGALELRLKQESKKTIYKASVSAFLGIILTSLVLSVLFYYLFGDGSAIGYILNALPFAVISSAVAIPTVSRLISKKKEFVVYESTLSDIIGVVIFNYLIINETVGLGSLTNLARDMALMVLLAGVASVGMIFLIQEIDSKIKLSFVLASLLLVYSASKSLHLPALVVVLIFGLLLNNADKIRVSHIQSRLKHLSIKLDTQRLFSLTAELAFAFRALLFVVFGITIDLKDLLVPSAWLYGSAIIAVVYIVRFVVLRSFNIGLSPNLFIAPRGLITILLFLSIPAQRAIPELNAGVLVFVILFSCLLMPFGLSSKNPPLAKKPIGEEKEIFD